MSTANKNEITVDVCFVVQWQDIAYSTYSIFCQQKEDLAKHCQCKPLHL